MQLKSHPPNPCLAKITSKGKLFVYTGKHKDLDNPVILFDMISGKEKNIDPEKYIMTA
jgi:hypothetical protein